jgi:subtilisin-like proprotein convertase family protein
LSGAIIDVNLTLNITHTRDSDLQIYLTDPFGTQILLIPSSNATGQNFSNTVFDDEASTEITSASAPYSGTFRPVQPLSAMDGQSPNGTWTLTVNDTRTSNSGTLNSWSIGVATGEPRAVSAPDGTYALRGNPPGTYSLRRVLQSGWFATQPLGGAASVTLGSALGAANVNFGQTQNPPVQVSSVSVNAGAAQRSRVTTIAVTFSQLVNLPANPADAFLLTRNGGGTVTFTAMASVVNGVTVVTLDNFTGAETEFGSLRDGRYTMTILANQVSNSFGQLDGNGDGIAGDNFTFGDNQGLFRYFGDVNGDQVVNGFDLGLFRNAFGTAAGDPNYLSYFDFNGDGVINGFDLGQFRTRFGTMLP